MSAFVLGRELTIEDAIQVVRRATFDPGQFTQRVRYHQDGQMETLERWQSRAVLVALAADKPDDRWPNTGPLITEYERAELDRVLPDATPTRS